ncbi:hypothetical protein [Pseudaminobacter salicylatoxidans]|uniref:hypothetical protein n=1 Tax=Pseudaminobacter salicylatoxidans TaxID=93369 RepID=UPI000D6D2BC0|nr:hypothetical protein [Pseudaminobacter salicylatoxidans]
MGKGDSPPQLPQDLDATSAQKAANAELEARIAQLEEQLAMSDLSWEWQSRRLLMSEIRQRINARRIATGVAIIAIIFMAALVAHSTHKFFWLHFITIPQSVAIAFVLGPIISITTLSVVLLIGAFRRFKDDDMDKVSVGSLATEAIRRAVS